MASELVVAEAGQRLQMLLGRLTTLASGLVVIAFLISAATFATGWWVFDGSTGWAVIGGLICLAPVATAFIARMRMRRATKAAPRLLPELRQYASSSSDTAQVIIDADTGQPIGAYVRNFGGVQRDLERRNDLPALYSSIRALVTVPAFAAVTVLLMLGVGALGTILLIGGLID
jgi:hypothetical protein